MDVLVIGGGGREHALCWRLARSPSVQRVHCAPGNPGIQKLARCHPVTEVPALVALATRIGVGLVVIGPEAPLAAGLADALVAAGIPTVGPGAAGARLEASKAYAKSFMQRHGIPSARSATFTDAGEAAAYIARTPEARVVKADGLAQGKGVFVCDSAEDASARAAEVLGGAFGGAGARVVIEERLTGPELSCIALTDGATVLPLALAQDYKRAGDGDRGPNTGGMGACSPPAPALPDVLEQVRREVLERAVAGLAKDGVPYVGFLYAGILLAGGTQPKLLEFNARLGDPEAQVLMMRWKGDLAATLAACAARRLAGVRLSWDERAATCVVVAGRGYPLDPKPGAVVEALGEDTPDAVAFHSGTSLDPDGRLVAGGGRVFSVTALGASPGEAARRAYERAGAIRFDGAWSRRDIGS